MTTRKQLLITFIAVFALLAAPQTLAADENSVGFSCQLLDSNADPIVGANVTVSIYDAASGGNQVHTETFNNATNSNGACTFNTLGDTGGVNLTEGQQYYTDLTVNGNDYNFSGNDRQAFIAWFGQDKNVNGTITANSFSGDGSGLTGVVTGTGNAGDAVRIGTSSSAGGFNAVAVGESSSASGGSSVAVGRRASASNTGASAFGFDATATGGSSTAVGKDSYAQATNAITIGTDVVANAANAVVIGSGNGGASQLTNSQSNSLIFGALNNIYLRVNSTGVYDASGNQLASDLNTLSDVGLASAADGEILVYNSTSAQWENQANEVSGEYNAAGADVYNVQTLTHDAEVSNTGTTIDWSTGNLQNIALSNENSTLTFQNPRGPGQLALRFVLAGASSSLNWQNQQSPFIPDEGAGMEVDTNGDVYVIENGDLVKYNSAGTQQWSKNINVKGLALSSSAVYAAGASNMLYRYDKNGNLVWQQSFAGEPGWNGNSILDIDHYLLQVTDRLAVVNDVGEIAIATDSGGPPSIAALDSTAPAAELSEVEVQGNEFGSSTTAWASFENELYEYSVGTNSISNTNSIAEGVIIQELYSDGNSLFAALKSTGIKEYAPGLTTTQTISTTQPAYSVHVVSSGEIYAGTDQSGAGNAKIEKYSAGGSLLQAYDISSTLQGNYPLALRVDSSDNMVVYEGLDIEQSAAIGSIGTYSFAQIPALSAANDIDYATSSNVTVQGDDVNWSTLNSSDKSVVVNYYYNGNGEYVAQAATTSATGGSSFDASGTGTDSLAIGNSATASGDGAAAYGNASTAAGLYGVAIGDSANASATDTVSIGRDSSVTTQQGISLGSEASSTAQAGIALGFQSSAALASVALGYQTDASGSFGIAQGFQAIANNTASIAIGNSAIASGGGGAAYGSNSQATGINAVAIGAGASSADGESVAIGDAASAGASAGGGVAIGPDSSVTGDFGSIALGDTSTTSGTSSIALGFQSIASGATSTAIGRSANASAENAHAFGKFTEASALNALALGTVAESHGNYSSALGAAVVNNGQNSFVVGDQFTSSVDNAFVYGSQFVEYLRVNDTGVYHKGTQLGTGGGVGTDDIGDNEINYSQVTLNDFTNDANYLTETGDGSSLSGVVTGSGDVGSSVALGNSVIASSGQIVIGEFSTASSANSITIGTGSDGSATSTITLGQGMFNNVDNNLLIGMGGTQWLRANSTAVLDGQDNKLATENYVDANAGADETANYNWTGDHSFSQPINHTQTGTIRTFANGCVETANATGVFITC